MATSNDTELKEYVVNYVESDEIADELAESGAFEEGQFVYTPDDDLNTPFMPVGSIFASAIPQTDARVHLLDGSTILQTGVYADFAKLIKALVSAGNNITYEDDEEFTANQKFNNDVSATGNCGKFVIDNTAGTIRLPKITTFIQGLSNIADIGKSLEAGLPSITHTHPQYITANSGAYMGRQDYTADRSSSDIYPHVDTGTNSAVSPIYGKSDTVQPPATQYPYYIVLASGYKSSQVVDVDNIMKEINNISTKTSGGVGFTDNQSFSPTSYNTKYALAFSGGSTEAKFTSTGKKLVVMGDLYAKTSSGTIWIHISIDGVDSETKLFINTSYMNIPFRAIFKPTAGEHTISIKISGTGTFSIPQWAYTNAYFFEI